MDKRKTRDIPTGRRDEQISTLCKKSNASSAKKNRTLASPSSTLTEMSPNVSSTLLADFFECPICLDYALPPIYQCKAGHLICATCRPKCSNTQEDPNSVSLCPTCRQPLDEIRNVALERLSELITFPCKFSTFGCLSKLSPTEKLDHENICHFKIICCPVPKTGNVLCTWQGGVNDVKKHVNANHKDITKLYGKDIIFLAADILIPAPAEWIMMQEVFGETFLIILNKKEHENNIMFYAFPVLLGSQSKGRQQFAYRLALNAPYTRMSWEALPKSIYDERSVWKSDCLKFDFETAKKFAKNNDLAINVVISPKYDEASDVDSDNE